MTPQDLVKLRQEARERAEEVLALVDEGSGLIHQIEKMDALQDIELFSESEQALLYRLQSHLIGLRESIHLNTYGARSFLESSDRLSDEQIMQAPEEITEKLREAALLSLQGSRMTLESGPEMLEQLRVILTEFSKYRSPSKLN